MAEELRVYDIEQRGWEHETQGFDANASHVLTHLAKGLLIKDFGDPNQVECEIAPDSVQYALRFARWGEFPVATITDSPLSFVDEHPPAAPLWERGDEAPGLRPYISATILLNAYVHDLGHTEARLLARRDVGETAVRISRHLLYSAQEQAAAFGFPLSTAFYDRLIELRDRFHIPQPD